MNATFAVATANPTVNLSVSSNSGTEADATAITVTATASSAVTGDQTVSLGVSGTNITAGDYTLTNTTITIPSGQTTGSLTFTIVDDALIEGTETATLAISSPSAGITLGATTTQNIAITDNDFDVNAPTVSYAALTATTATSNRDLTGVISDNTAVTAARIYYRKNAGGYVSNACVSGGGSSYTCTIDYSLVGGTAAGDTISYFVVAQDAAGNLASSPAGITGNDVNAVTIPPNYAPNAYSIGDSTVAPGNYTTLALNGATLNGNVTVTENLSLNGIVNNGTFTMTLNSSAGITRNSGYIIGNLTKQFFFAPQTFVNDEDRGLGFLYPVGTANGYSPVTAFVVSISSSSSLSVFAKQGTQPNLGSTTTLQRYWTLTETGDLTANLQFSYNDPLDINGTEASYQVIRVASGFPAFYTPSAVDAVNNTLTATNVSDFSDWTAGTSIISPTAADAEISGRVINTNNRGLENVTLTLSGGSLIEPLVTTTNAMGRYRFTEIEAGETYILTVTSKRHRFNQPSTAFTVSGNLANVNFVGTGW